MTTTNQDTVGEFPLWRVLLRKMREQENYGYGAQWETAFFEAGLGSQRGTPSFAFQMLDLRAEMECEDGYYLRSETVEQKDTGKRVELWTIPGAWEHEGVACNFEERMKRYAHRSVDIRSKTLMNKAANLADAEKASMEGKMRIAATRLVLLRREKGIANFLTAKAPKLLK